MSSVYKPLWSRDVICWSTLKLFQIDLTVLDKNDNAPAFVFDEELSDLLSSNQYLVSVQDNTPIGSPIIQIQVTFFTKWDPVLKLCKQGWQLRASIIICQKKEKYT